MQTRRSRLRLIREWRWNEMMEMGSEKLRNTKWEEKQQKKHTYGLNICCDNGFSFIFFDFSHRRVVLCFCLLLVRVTMLFSIFMLYFFRVYFHTNTTGINIYRIYRRGNRYILSRFISAVIIEHGVEEAAEEGSWLW